MNPAMLAKALSKSLHPHVHTGDHVPYLAGMSRNGAQLYFSRDFPHALPMPDGRILDPKPFVTLHEEVETKAMKAGADYLPAHHFATKVEHAAVARAGFNPSDYEQALRPYINKAHDDPGGRRVPELNPKPYRQEHEMSLLNRR